MKHKITPEVRKQITKLCQELPQVPFFIQGSNGMIPQRVANGKRVSGFDVSAEDRAKIGESFSVKNDYVQRFQTTRMMMNHKVNLTSMYSNDGQDGIIAYTSYVNQLKQMIDGMKKPKGLTLAPEGPPISEEEGKDIVEAYDSPEMDELK